MNRILTVSSYIQLPEAEGFLKTLNGFAATGVPANTLVTINLEQLGHPQHSCFKAMQDGLKRLQGYLKTIGNPWAVVWVLENVHPVGVHGHILIHRTEQFQGDLYRDFRACLLRAFDPEGLKIRRAIRMIAFRHWYSRYEDNLGNLERYLLKGIRPELAPFLGINPKSQGEIIGKRIGWSRATASTHRMENLG